MECDNMKSEKDGNPLNSGGAESQHFAANNIATVKDGPKKQRGDVALSNGIVYNMVNPDRKDEINSLENCINSDENSSMQLDKNNCAFAAKSVINKLVNSLIETVISGSSINGAITIGSAEKSLLKDETPNRIAEADISQIKVTDLTCASEHTPLLSDKQNDTIVVSQTKDQKTNSFISPNTPTAIKGCTGSVPDIMEKIDTISVSSTEVPSGHTPGPHRVSKRKRIPKKIVDEVKKEIASPIVREKLPVVETAIAYNLGDLVWSHVPGHPLWPCMVLNDPMEPIFTKMKGGGCKSTRAYHVQFLGDSPEHGWIRETKVFPFMGPDDYERIVKEIAAKHKKIGKAPRLEIPARLKDDWESGVDEIVEAVSYSAEERIQKFGYDFRPHMRKMLKKKIHDEECKNLLEDLISAANDVEESADEDHASDSKSQSESFPNSCTVVGDDMILSVNAASKKQCIQVPKCNSPVSEKRSSFSQLCKELTNSAILTSAESGTTNLNGAAGLIDARHDLQERQDCASSNLSGRRFPIFAWGKKVHMKTNPNQIDFSAFGGLPPQCSRTSSGRMSSLESSISVDIPITDEGNESLVPNEFESKQDKEKIEMFRNCLKLIKGPQTNVVSKEVAEAVASSLKSIGVKDRSYKQCTCTALQQVRGLQGGYKLETLLDAMSAIDNGFSTSAVSTNFNIPRSTLYDLKKRSVFSVKHHVKCKMFPDGVSVISDSLIRHIKSADNCRRLRLAKPPIGSVEHTPSKDTPVVVLKRHSSCSPSLQKKPEILKMVDKKLEPESLSHCDEAANSNDGKIKLTKAQQSTSASANHYSFEDLLSAIDEYISSDGVCRSYTAIGRKYNIPLSTLRKSVVKSEPVYKKHINDEMTKKERLSILRKHCNALRIRGSKPFTIGTSELVAKEKFKFPSFLQVSKSKRNTRSNTRLRVTSKMTRKCTDESKKAGNIFAPARNHNYTMETVRLAVAEATKTGIIYQVARKYGIPESTLRGKVSRFVVSQQRKQNFLKKEIKEGYGCSENDLTNAVNKAVKDGCLKYAANKFCMSVATLRGVVEKRKHIVLPCHRKPNLAVKKGFSHGISSTRTVEDDVQETDEVESSDIVRPTTPNSHAQPVMLDEGLIFPNNTEEAMLRVPENEENVLVCTLSVQLSWNWRLTPSQIKSRVSEYLNECTAHTLENDSVPNDWIKSFLQKNDLTPCLEDTTVELKPNPFKMFCFFNKLERHIELLKDDPGSIYMIHEFVLQPLNEVYEVRVLAAVNAAGRKSPPLMVFKGTSLWCSSPNCYPGAQFAVSSSGEMTSLIWREWFTTFCTSGKPPPELLLYDGDTTSIPLDFVRILHEANTPMLKLPYPTSASFQLPYAEAVNGVSHGFRKTYAESINSRSDVIESVSTLWRSCFNPNELKAVFKNSGFFPFDREKFPFESSCDKGDYKSRNSAASNSERRKSPRHHGVSVPQTPLQKDNQHGLVVITGGTGGKVGTDGSSHQNDEISPSTKGPTAQNSKPQWKPKIKKPSNIQVKNGRSAKLKKKDMLAALMEPDITPNKELFKFYCEKRRGPLKAEHPNLTPEQEEALMWMEWETLSPEKQQKFGKKRGSETSVAIKRRQRPENSPAPKQKRGRRQKYILVRPQETDEAASESSTPDSNVFKCSVCNISYPSKHSLSQHKRWCSDVPTDTPKKLPEKGASLQNDLVDSSSLERTFTCEGCGEKFYGEQSLQIHRKFCSANQNSSLSTTLSSVKKIRKERSKNIRSPKGLPRLSAMMLDGTTHESTSKDIPSSNKPTSTGDAACDGGCVIGHNIQDGSPIMRKFCRPRGRPQLGSTSKKENICTKCELAGPGLVTCVGACFQSVHLQCLGADEKPEDEEHYKCRHCANHTHPCFICQEGPESSNKDLGEIKRCNVQNCGRSYHTSCLHVRKLSIVAAAEDSGHETLDSFRSAMLSNSRCTLHHCATCASKVTNVVSSSNVAGSRMFKCIRCPTAYHAGDDCIAAGSIILPGFNIICPEHFVPMKNTPYHQPVHVSWCFICSKGGELLCCESCPAAFHPKCVDMDAPPEGEWYCKDCRYRRRPLYGDIVWVKLGSYRWWPGEITHPNDIPENIRHLRHGVGEFVVNFFGSNDYFWLNKRRVFAYQEGDTGASSGQCSRGISSVFHKALRDASKKFDELTSQRQKIQDVKIQKQRPQYKYIKVNKPVGNVQVYVADVSEIPRCICKRTDRNPCGPDSECLNRMLMFECHTNFCPAGDKCQNQHFQKRDYPPSEVFKTSWGGWGLKTKVAIKKGEFVNEYVGELVDSEECLRRIEHAHKNNITNFYMLTIDKDRIIDAGPKGNYSRFMNHSCDPSCETQKWTVNGDTRVGLFARKEIAEGEELTFNYNLDCLGNDKTPCMCGASNCSGFIGVRPKPSIDNGKSADPKAKKKRRRNEQRELPKHDDFCFRCRQVGTLVCCDVRGCQRAFCLSCLRLTKPPFGKWECPWHHCDFCGRRAQSFCHFCPNSFCASHVSNQLMPSLPNQYDCCTDHDPSVAEYEMEEAIAAVVASMTPQEIWDETIDTKDPEEEVDEQNKEVSKRKLKKENRLDRNRAVAEKQKLKRHKKNNVGKAKQDEAAAIAVKEEVTPAPATSNETETEEELAAPTSSPVRRKRAKRRYFTGKKKRRKSKAISSLNSSFAEAASAEMLSTDDTKLQSRSDGEQDEETKDGLE